MDILLIAATEAEIAPFLRLPDTQRRRFDTLITGVGMVATAYAVGRRLANSSYRLLLNAGIAGSFDRSIALGDVVCIAQDTLAELGAEDGERFIDSESMNLAPHTYHHDPGFTASLISNLRPCRGITVNTVHGYPPSIDAVVRRLQPETESMEGAAVFHAAQQAGLPVIQVRAVSNYVERRDRSSWEVALAIDNLNQWLMSFSERLDYPVDTKF